jgi:flagellar protein FlaG
MANEISSMVLAQLPASASRSGQFEKPEAVKVPDTGAQALPEQGKELPQQAEKSQSSASKAEIEQAVSQINNFVQSVKRDLSFSTDEASGKTVIKVIDSDSGKLIRQIPSEEVLALANHLQGLQDSAPNSEKMPPGILFSDST